MKGKKAKSDPNPFHKKHQTIEPEQIFVFPMRLNKYIAKCGVCSRRKAVDLVAAGKISVNGEVQKIPYTLIEETDEVIYQGKQIKPEENLIYLLLNKPKDIISTSSDEHNRKTVLDHIAWPGPERLFSVGRLDRQTTGLLLITNDGDLTKRLSHPSHEVKKKYEVTLDQGLSDLDFHRITNGHELDDGLVPVLDIRYPNEPSREEVEITISVGRNRIVRRLFESLGYEVLRLDRTYLGGLTKKNLPRGKFRLLTPREIVMLKHFS